MGNNEESVSKPGGGNINLGDFKVRDFSCDPRLQKQIQEQEPDKHNILSSDLVGAGCI